MEATSDRTEALTSESQSLVSRADTSCRGEQQRQLQTASRPESLMIPCSKVNRLSPKNNEPQKQKRHQERDRPQMQHAVSLGLKRRCAKQRRKQREQSRNS